MRSEINSPTRQGGQRIKRNMHGKTEIKNNIFAHYLFIRSPPPLLNCHYVFLTVFFFFASKTEINSHYKMSPTDNRNISLDDFRVYDVAQIACTRTDDWTMDGRGPGRQQQMKRVKKTAAAIHRNLHERINFRFPPFSSAKIPFYDFLIQCATFVIFIDAFSTHRHSALGDVEMYESRQIASDKNGQS